MLKIGINVDSAELLKGINDIRKGTYSLNDLYGYKGDKELTQRSEGILPRSHRSLGGRAIKCTQC